jgi:hypothetical protein
MPRQEFLKWRVFMALADAGCSLPARGLSGSGHDVIADIGHDGATTV